MRILIFIWLAFLTAISLMPLAYKDAMGTTGRFHSWGHFLLFAVTALLLCWRAKTPAVRVARGLIAAGIGLLLEELEHMLYHHHFEWIDVLTDGLGVVAGLLVLTVLPNLLGSSASARVNSGN